MAFHGLRLLSLTFADLLLASASRVRSAPSRHRSPSTARRWWSGVGVPADLSSTGSARGASSTPAAKATPPSQTDVTNSAPTRTILRRRSRRRSRRCGARRATRLRVAQLRRLLASSVPRSRAFISRRRREIAISMTRLRSRARSRRSRASRRSRCVCFHPFLTPSHAFPRLLTPSHAFSRPPTPSHAFSRPLTPSHALVRAFYSTRATAPHV